MQAQTTRRSRRTGSATKKLARDCSKGVACHSRRESVGDVEKGMSGSDSGHVGGARNKHTAGGGCARVLLLCLPNSVETDQGLVSNVAGRHRNTLKPKAENSAKPLAFLSTPVAARKQLRGYFSIPPLPRARGLRNQQGAEIPELTVAPVLPGSCTEGQHPSSSLPTRRTRELEHVGRLMFGDRGRGSALADWGRRIWDLHELQGTRPGQSEKTLSGAPATPSPRTCHKPDGFQSQTTNHKLTQKLLCFSKTSGMTDMHDNFETHGSNCSVIRALTAVPRDCPPQSVPWKTEFGHPHIPPNAKMGYPIGEIARDTTRVCRAALRTMIRGRHS